MEAQKSALVKTKSKIHCVVFGAPKDLSELVLPTYEEIMKCYLYIKNDIKTQNNNKEPSVSEVSEIIANKLESLWLKATIPVVSRTRVLQMIQTYHEKYRNILKPFKGRKVSNNYQIKLKKFREEASKKMFDISSCKCVEYSLCSCPKDRKVPERERVFLLDQRTERKMIIGGIDVCTSLKLTEKFERQEKEASRIAKQRKLQPEILSTPKQKYDQENVSDSAVMEENILIDMPSTSKGSLRIRQKLPCLAMACDRTGVSDRTAALIASAALEDFGIISKQDAAQVIDRMKIRRQRKKQRTNSQVHLLKEGVPIRGLYFDGRKDKTIVQEIKGEKRYRRTITEEHISLVQEPGSNYIGHITPASGNAIAVKDSILKFFKENLVDGSHLVAVGCDGTVLNTGTKGGVIRRLEQHFGKPLQWLVCLLHLNELPLRHLLHHLDGQTTGPVGLSGPIGKQLQNCENLPVVKFKRIDCELTNIDKKDLSTDQRYLLSMCQAISNGNCSLDLSRKNPGKLSHARWLTTANRILRLYVSTRSPSTKLRVLTEYIIKVYGPVWFKVKSKHSCKDGAKHLFSIIKLSRYLTDELKAIIDPVIQRNGYFGHPENILLSMITDERREIRELGIRRIIKARKVQKGIRVFDVPPLNFSASDYIDMINWTDCEVTEPPVTRGISDQDLEILLSDITTPKLEFPRFPCHTQAVERCVKVVTEASTSVCGAKARDGFISVRLKSRNLMPSFHTKAEYKAATSKDN